MAIYKSGSVTLTVGSSSVLGGGTLFSTYASVGYLFKRSSDAAFYEIAAIQNATNLTLTTRFDDANQYTVATGEHLATTNAATRTFSGIVTHTPLILNNVVLTASNYKFTDNGGGTLMGRPSGTGSVDYDSGAFSVRLGTHLNASRSIVASYLYGNVLTGVSYQIVKDYTPNYNFPEMSTNDINFAHLFTKAIRMIDTELKTINDSIVTINDSITTINDRLTASL